MIRSLLKRLGEIAQQEESGQAMTEAVIVLPMQFLLIAGIIQLSLHFTAQIVVNHAAFRAARAALVADEASIGPQNSAERAAIFTCSSIAGTSDVNGNVFLSIPSPSGDQQLPRSAAAAAKTRVRVIYNRNGLDLRATVSHDFELVVPVVRHLFKTPGLPYASPHVTLTEQCILPCPWTRK